MAVIGNIIARKIISIFFNEIYTIFFLVIYIGIYDYLELLIIILMLAYYAFTLASFVNEYKKILNANVYIGCIESLNINSNNNCSQYFNNIKNDIKSKSRSKVIYQLVFTSISLLLCFSKFINIILKICNVFYLYEISLYMICIITIFLDAACVLIAIF